MKIFQLTHRHIFEDGSFEDKGIGYFRTESDCYKAIDFLLSKPGFCDLLKGFHIDELSLETNQDEKNINAVYEVTCDPVDDRSDVPLLGVFADEQTAQSVANTWPKCLTADGELRKAYVDKYPIGEINWSDGYDTYVWYKE